MGTRYFFENVEVDLHEPASMILLGPIPAYKSVVGR